MTTAELLWSRFVHRSDAYNVQTYSEEKNEIKYFRPTVGECPNNPPCHKRVCEHIQSVPLTQQDIQEHLDGKQTLGIYQLTEDNTVLWGCIDVDIMKKAEGDDLEAKVKKQTLAVATVLRGLIGPKFVVEFSGSKGYHIWVLFEEPTQARFVFSLLRHVVTKVKPIEGISFEVFPKQTALRSFGNQVKLPLGIHKKTGKRCLFVNGRFETHKDQHGVLENTPRLNEKELLVLLADNKIEVISSIRIEPNGNQSKSRTGLPCMSRLMNEGAGEGNRDLSMFYAASFLRDRGIPYDLGEVVMLELNKKNKPPMHEEDVIMKTESAYVTDYSPFPCNRREMDQYCSSECRFWDTKLQEQWVRYGLKKDEAVGRISRD